MRDSTVIEEERTRERDFELLSTPSFDSRVFGDGHGKRETEGANAERAAKETCSRPDSKAALLSFGGPPSKVGDAPARGAEPAPLWCRSGIETIDQGAVPLDGKLSRCGDDHRVVRHVHAVEAAEHAVADAPSDQLALEVRAAQRLAVRDVVRHRTSSRGHAAVICNVPGASTLV